MACKYKSRVCDNGWCNIACMYCTFTQERNCEHNKKTNADRIRGMNDEELAKYLVDIGWDCHLCAEHRRLDNEPLMCGKKCDEKCAEHCLEWLQQPAEEET